MLSNRFQAALGRTDAQGKVTDVFAPGIGIFGVSLSVRQRTNCLTSSVPGHGAWGKENKNSGGFWEYSEPSGLRSPSLLRRVWLGFISCTARGLQARKHIERSLIQTSLYFHLFILFPFR